MSSASNMRAENIRAVLSIIRGAKRVSRNSIQRATGLSHGAVTEMVASLIESGWLSEVEETKARKRGRPTRYVTLNPSKGCVIALSVDSNAAHGTLYDLSMEPIHRASTHFPAGANRDQILDGLHRLTQQLIDQAPSRVLGLGISVPGTVDSQSGVARSASRIPQWKDVPIGDEMIRAFSIPTYVDQDCRLLARGHLEEGRIGEQDVALSVWLGDGIGAGIVIWGKVFTGLNGLAGEVGHLHVADDGPLCSCGNVGCLETIASTRAILARVREALDHGVSSHMTVEALSLEELARWLAEGDKLAATVCHEVAIAIGKALSQAINLLSPARIILSGPITSLGDPLMSGIRQTLVLHAHSEMMQGLEIDCAGPSSEPILKGAASLALDPVWESVATGRPL